MLVIGLLYIAWIGGRCCGEAAGADDGPDLPAMSVMSRWATFRRAAFTCLMNPKAYLYIWIGSAVPACRVQAGLVQASHSPLSP